MKDIKFPFAIDKATGKPSVTLFFAYVAFIIASCATGYLIYRDAVVGTTSALMLFFGCLLIYRLRQIDKFKVNLSERSLEVEDTPDIKEEK